MPVLQSDNFDAQYAAAQPAVSGERPGADANAARIEQWRREEWHGWARWKMAAGGIDWSKVLWIFLLTGGFAALCYYGYSTGRLFVTAGGVVAWFTLVNLSLLVYFGPLMPPPSVVAGPFESEKKVRAKIGIYPPGYLWRKLARVWIKMDATSGEPFIMELTLSRLPDDLQQLIKRQEFWRIQRADAPATDAVIETMPVSREQINAGAHPVRVIAWRWDEQKLETFKKSQ